MINIPPARYPDHPTAHIPELASGCPHQQEEPDFQLHPLLLLKMKKHIFSGHQTLLNLK